MKVRECCSYAPKSSIKAGEAIVDGEYMFFTSSSDENKRFSEYLFDNEGIIMGTGGNATLHYYNGKYAVSSDCVVLLPDERLRCKYLYYFFKANLDVLERGFKGAGLRHTNKQYIGDIELGDVPSLDSQVKVVEILSKIEKLIAIRNEQLMDLDMLVKARFIEMFGDILCNDKGWPIYTLDTISSSRLGKMLDAKRNTGKNSFPYLANFNVQWFKLDLSELHEMDFDDADREEFSLKDGDLLITEGGEVGRCAIWHNEVPDCYFQKALHRVRCDKNIILPEYLAWWFKFHSDFNGFEDIVGGKATIAHLPGVKLKKMQIEVPDINVQKDFVSFWRDIDKSKVAIQNAVDKAQLLFDSLMQRYFG